MLKLISNKYNLLLFLIITFAFIVRILFITNFPPSLNWDEVSHGYNAYSILKTSNDEWGQNFPIIFRAYGDYKLPVYIYLTAISEAVFGVNTFSVRFTSILAGTLLVFFVYLLSFKLTNKKEIGLIAAFLTAIEPWSLFLSRVALEANLALFFIVSGVYLFLEGLEKKSKWIYAGLLLLGLSVWTYNSARIFVPLILIYLFIVNFQKIKAFFTNESIKVIISLAILIIFFVPMFFQLLNPTGRARFENVQIFGGYLVEKVERARNENHLSEQVERLVFNKATIFVLEFGKNYLTHFSSGFLYLTGGDNYQFNVQGYGLLYMVGMPFLLYGVYCAYKKKYKLLFAWLIFAPIAASFTRESPHTLRSIVMLPIPFIFTAIGMSELLNKIKQYKKLFVISECIMFLLSFVYYLNLYTNSYTNKYSSSWQFGYKEVAEYINNNYEVYDKILFTKKYGEPHEFMLYYDISLGGNKYAEPEKFLTDNNLVRFYQSNWYWVDRFDKFYFYNDWEVPKDNGYWILESKERVSIEGRVLLVASPDNYPLGWNHIKTVNFLDGSPAFEILKN